MSRKYIAAKRAARRRSALTRRWAMLGALLVIVVIVAIAFSLKANPDNAQISAPDITVQEAYRLYQEGVFFLDVREQSEWDSFHIPNTTLIPLGELPNRLNELPTDQPIVVVCRTGNRSPEGRDILLAAGFTNVTSMTGGVTEWSNLGYPIEGTRP
ncbi:MAG: rhodanese-like domain-containing protein [Anaerolinea sp.]|nr:rhodanese-like domain-containing protein [Anaerolinea sp.]